MFEKVSLKFSIITILLLLLLGLSSCSKNNDLPNKIHVLDNKDISPYIIIKAKSYHIYNFEDKLEETTTFDLYLNVASNYIESNTNINYELIAINAFDERITYKSKTEMVLPINEQIVNSTNISGNGFKEFYLKVFTDKEHLFYEEVIPSTSKEIKRDGYPDEFISEDIKLQIKTSEDSEKYTLDFIIDTDNEYHIDFQTFLVSYDARVYMFGGLYNYFRNEFPITVNNNYIYKDMNIEYLYLRLFYYDQSNNKQEVRAKYLISDLV